MLSAITFDQLMFLTVKAFYIKNLDPQIKDFILFTAHKNGLVDEQDKRTSKYLSFINDHHEKLIRELTGYQKKPAGLCACGCGKNPRGHGQYATEACRTRACRKRKVTDHLEKKHFPEKSPVELAT